MAMQQLILPAQKHSASWMSIFSHDITTVTGSMQFVKQLTALAFSCITYMRSIFPESAYIQREIDEVKVKLLSGSYDCKDAYLMTRWIKSAFNALENKYMRELVLEILSQDNKPLEYYAIVYKYNDDGPSCLFSTNANSKRLDFDVSEVENSTKKLITTLLTVTEALGELPKKYILQLRINYYDDITPLHYKPKYFNHAEACDLLKLENMKHESMGTVKTPYLALSVYSGSRLLCLDESRQSFFQDLEEGKHLKIEKNNEMEMVQQESRQSFFQDLEEGKHLKIEKNNEMEMVQSSESIDVVLCSGEKTDANQNSCTVEEGTESIDVVTCSEEMPASTKNSAIVQNILAEDDTKTDTEYTWNFDKSANSEEDLPKTQVITPFKAQLFCICAHNYETDKESLQNSSETFHCHYCSTSHHYVCYKKIPGCRELEVQCCYACAKSDSTDCTDPSLMKYKPKQAKHLAVYRQVIYRLQNRKTIKLKTFDELGIKNDLAQNMIRKLNEESFIKPKKSSNDSFTINKAKIKHFIKVYFEL